MFSSKWFLAFFGGVWLALARPFAQQLLWSGALSSDSTAAPFFGLTSLAIAFQVAFRLASHSALSSSTLISPSTPSMARYPPISFLPLPTAPSALFLFSSPPLWQHPIASCANPALFSLCRSFICLPMIWWEQSFLLFPTAPLFTF